MDRSLVLKKVILITWMSIVSTIFVACGGGGGSDDTSTEASSLTDTTTQVDGTNETVQETALSISAGSDKITQVNTPTTIQGYVGGDLQHVHSYEWRKGDTILATTLSFVYTPTSVGTEELTLVVIDDNANRLEDSMLLEVRAEYDGDPLPF